MEFVITTTYTQAAMTGMARALRKTIRARRSRRSTMFGCFAVGLGICLLLISGEFGAKSILTALAILVIVLTLLFQDRMNGYITFRRMLPGMESDVVTFREEGYHSETALGSSDFLYSGIQVIAEDPRFFYFIFSPSHGQIHQKDTLTGGSLEEFREFLRAVTGKEIRSVT